MATITNVFDAIPASAFEVITSAAVSIYEGKKVKKIEYKELISFPDRFGKGLVAFLVTTFTLGFALAIGAVRVLLEEVFTGYTRKQAYLRLPPEYTPPPEKLKEDNPIPPLEEAKEDKPIPPPLDPLAPPDAKPSIKHSLSEEERKQYEIQLLNKLAANESPQATFVQLVDSKKEKIRNIVVSAKDKIIKAWIRSKIPREERTESIKTSGLISRFAKKWRNASAADIQSGIFDKEILSCVKACRQNCNRVGLLLIAYSLFSRISYHYPNSNPFTCLKALLYDQVSSLHDIEIVFEKCLTVMKTIEQEWFNLEKSNKESTHSGNYWSSKFEDDEKKNPEELVSFSHGGGFFFFLDLLNKRTAGYPLEAERGFGIQVHPWSSDTDRGGWVDNTKMCDRIVERERHDYASKSTYNFDLPIRVSGAIQAKFLETAPNGYEAGIHAHDLRNIMQRLKFSFQQIANKRIKYTRFEDPLLAKIWKVDEQDLQNLFPDHPGLQKAIGCSIKATRFLGLE